MKLRFFALSGAAVVCFAAMAPAQAKTCPSGQILRVSKNMCMDKGEAMKLGIVRGGGKSEAARAKKAVTANAEPEADDAPKAKSKAKVEPRPEKTAKAAPGKVLDEPKAVRAVEPPKSEARPLEAPEPAGKGKTVRVIPLSTPAASPSPAPAAAQLAPIEPPKALTPSPFGSLGGGALGAAPAMAAPMAGGRR